MEQKGRRKRGHGNDLVVALRRGGDSARALHAHLGLLLGDRGHGSSGLSPRGSCGHDVSLKSGSKAAVRSAFDGERSGPPSVGWTEGRGVLERALPGDWPGLVSGFLPLFEFKVYNVIVAFSIGIHFG